MLLSLPPADIFGLTLASTATPGVSGGLYLHAVGSYLELIKSCASLKAAFKRQHQTPVPTPRATPPCSPLSPEGKKGCGQAWRRLPRRRQRFCSSCCVQGKQLQPSKQKLFQPQHPKTHQGQQPRPRRDLRSGQREPLPSYLFVLAAHA